MSTANEFLAARDLLIRHRDNYELAYREFQWPRTADFNWALDYFDGMASGNNRMALRIVDDEGVESALTFAEISTRSNRVANYLRNLGVRRGDRILVMLPNVVPLWELTLAIIKLGAVISPTATLLTRVDLEDRIERGGMCVLITDHARAPLCDGLRPGLARITIGGALQGWSDFNESQSCSADFSPEGATAATDPLLLYFTSGTTAKAKMVLHTQASYPVGHLSTMYWLGLRPDDVHWNISSPGWAKHAWSCFFAPWNAGAGVFIFEQTRFDAKRTLDSIVRCGVTSLCAPPTVWRAFALLDLASYPVRLREVLSAGEPLNAEIIDKVRSAWGLTIRDGYGQTETTCIIGNSPGQEVKAGSMGRPMPGYRVVLLDTEGQEGTEGEVSVALDPPPVSIMHGYAGDEQRTADALGGTHYRTSDVAMRDANGCFTFVGRTDDVFKSSDYRVSPFELESVLIEHPSVAEAAVVPSPDPQRLAVPKGFVVLKPGVAPSADAARALFVFLRERVAPFKRIRRIQFSELPKTISGKIRRVELRNEEAASRASNLRGVHEYWEDDFLNL
jgi:acetyl-CoA synthetase